MPKQQYVDKIRLLMAQMAKEGHQIIPILPKNGLYLCNLSQNEGKRFASLFQQTWSYLPLKVRRRLLAFWQTPAEIPVANWVPTISLTDARLDRDWEKRDTLRGTWAQVGGNGQVMDFWSPVVRKMPDEIVCDLIAHELAHVFQHAEGWLNFDLRNNDSAGLVDKNGMAHPDGSTMSGVHAEWDADELMSQWGFDPYAMDDWFREVSGMDSNAR